MNDGMGVIGHSLKHNYNILTSSDLWVKCTVCGKKTLLEEILASHTDGYVPFNQEECDPTVEHLYGGEMYAFEENSEKLRDIKLDLQEAFNDLMKEFPDGSAR